EADGKNDAAESRTDKGTGLSYVESATGASGPPGGVPCGSDGTRWSDCSAPLGGCCPARRAPEHRDGPRRIARSVPLSVRCRSRLTDTGCASASPVRRDRGPARVVGGAVNGLVRECTGLVMKGECAVTGPTGRRCSDVDGRCG